MPRTPGRLRRAGRRRFVTGAKSDFHPGSELIGPPACSPKPHHRASAQIPMTYIETLAWGLGLFAFARLVLAPLGDYLSRRYVAADPWSATQ